MNEFTDGDYVLIVCTNGATYKGVLQGFDNECECPWFMLNGCGFPMEDVVTMDHA